MNDLIIRDFNGQLVTDSREVAEMIGKEHKNLLADIRTYLEYMRNNGVLKIQPSDFFTESTYINSQNKVQPCFEITRKGCELIANKMTGEKGVLFTAAYVTKFEEMEKQLNSNIILTELSPELQELISIEFREKQLHGELIEIEQRKLRLMNGILRIPSPLFQTANAVQAVDDVPMKLVKRFISEKCELLNEARISVAEFYNSFFRWCRDEMRIEPISKMKTSMRMIKMGIGRYKGKYKRYWVGIKVNETQ